MTVPTIVRVHQATKHLGLSDGAHAGALEAYIRAATQLVCEYICDRNPEDEDWIATIEGWTPTTAPPVIVSAVLVQVGELYRFRGDDTSADRPDAGSMDGSLSPLVTRLLHRYRSPSLA